MTTIDPTTNLGKVRLTIGDWQDLVILPDSVIAQTLTDSGDNVRLASTTCAQYILVTLSFKSHRKMAQLESWSNQQYEQYKDFLMMLVRDPSFSGIAPIPYNGAATTNGPIVQFIEDWGKNYNVTQSQQLAFDASNSPNDGSTYGVLGSAAGGWTEVV